MTTSDTSTLKRSAFVFIMLTAFLSAMGYGINTPVAPFLVSRYVSDPNSAGLALGWLSSIYAVCAFIVAPGFGALSDRYGRRPILLICLLGSAIGYLIFGFGGALWALFLGRIIDGLTGGNGGVMFAYIADLVAPDERGKYFGLVGAVVGVGFIFGPALGGLAAKVSLETPFYLAALLTFINVIYGFFFMPESLQSAQRTDRMTLQALNPLVLLRDVSLIPRLRWLLIATFLFTVPFAALLANLGLFAKDNLHWEADSIAAVFVMVGITDIFVQGILLRWLLDRFGESLVVISGLCGEVLAYVLIAFVVIVPSPILLILGNLIFGIGDGLLGPSLGGLLSRAAGEHSQGVVQGGSQSVQSVARIIGPFLGGILYVGFGHASPYLAGAAIVILAVGAIGVALTRLS